MILSTGVQLAASGVLGLYLYVVFLESKGRPNCVVKDVVAPDDRDTSHQ